MPDLTPYIPVGRPVSEFLRESSTGLDDPRGGFMEEMAAAGFTPPRVLRIGKLERVDAPGDTKGKLTGWYVYNEFQDGDRVLGVGVYGSWRGAPEKVTWVSKATSAMNEAERVNYNHQLEVARQQRELEQREMHATAAREVVEMLATTEPCPDSHPYLKRKGVKALGQCRVTSNGLLALPMLTVDGSVASCQYIHPDGTKRFKTGGRKRGCFYPIPGDDATVYLVEGYATGASVHAATGALVYVAFDAGNLYEVATAVRSLHPNSRLVVAADDDQFSVGNAGRTKAMQAAEAIGGECAFPTFTPEQLAAKPTDWNDLHALAGLAEVKRQLKGLPTVYKVPAPAATGTDAVPPPVGVLRDLVDYYNATSGNHQPLFAVQTALAITSVVLGRSFATNLGNMPMLFLMNLGKSATGKEHAKRTIEKVLEACGEGGLIGPDGYTAGSAVFSALVERPRHITVIDEFSKYIHAAQFKNGNSHLMEANSQMMQVFGRGDGILRPKSYSTIGLAKDKRAELSNLKVVAPHITLLAMSTPDDLFEKIDFASVKDGFLNRFLVCTSETPRSVRRHKEPLPVPQRVLDWCATIALRRGTEPDSATEEPRTHTLVFAQEAVEMQETFQLECIQQAEKLERFGLAEMPMRANEIAMRVALIHALSRDPQAEYVMPEDMAWACAWVRYNCNDLVRRLKACVSGSEFEGMKKAALLAIRNAGEAGVSTARMQVDKPFSTYREKDLKEVLKALEEADLVYKDASKNGKRGRPVTVYYASGE
jgi:phage/plasmid primase-like uncharacterized protein